MNVTALDLAGLPGVARAEALATQAAARLLASLPPAWDVELSPLGGARVSPVAVGAVPADVIPLAIRRDGVEGRLCVPAGLAARWVDRAISGREVFAPVRALGPAERGVLIALLAPMLDPIGWSLALGTWASPSGPAIVLRVEAAAGVGTIWLSMPADAASGAGPALRSMAALPIEVGVRMASTAVAADALVDLQADDIVLFDGVSGVGPASGGPVDVHLAVGEFRALARAEADGALAVVQGWRATAVRTAKGATPDDTQRKDPPMDADKTEPDAATLAAATLAAAPIEVVAELGRITLRGDEILGLAPGVVLGLRVDRTSAVSLRVGGELWAEGELVNVDGELGVRVTRLVPR